MRRLIATVLAVYLTAGGMVAAGPAETMDQTFALCLRDAPNVRKAKDELARIGWQGAESDDRVHSFYADKRKSVLLVNSNIETSFDCTFGISGLPLAETQKLADRLVKKHMGPKAISIDPQAFPRVSRDAKALWVVPGKPGQVIMAMLIDGVNAEGYFRGSMIAIKTFTRPDFDKANQGARKQK